MADLLGTMWWSILCAVGGFAAGVVLAERVKRMLGRSSDYNNFNTRLPQGGLVYLGGLCKPSYMMVSRGLTESRPAAVDN